MSQINQFLNDLFRAKTPADTTSAPSAGQQPEAAAPAAGQQAAAPAPGPADQQPAPDGAAQPAAGGRKAHIYNLIIVDESGSMSHLREATLSGINETIGSIKSAQREFAATQQHYLTLVTFDANGRYPAVRTLIDRKPIADVADFRDYRPNGGTPLYDAMGQSLTALERHVRDDADASVVVTVLTDGLENASREWNAHRLRQLVERLKEEGWSFAYMGSAHNVKEVTDLLAIENVVEFSHDVMGSSSTWRRDSASRLAMYAKLSMMYDSDELEKLQKEEIMARKRRFAREYYSDRVTPPMITELRPGEVFVFGSNAQGMHDGGAARTACRLFGAIYGQGEGMQGQSYAIPTMGSLEVCRAAVVRFTLFAQSHPELRFLVTPIGCGTAGYRPDQIAPLFEDCIKLENVTLPADFWKELGLSML